MEHVVLNREQRLYLQYIWEQFCQANQWPTFHQVDRFFYQTYPDLDIEDIGQSLPPDLTNKFDVHHLDTYAKLTIPGIYALDPNMPELKTFVAIIRLLVQVEQASQSNEIGSEKILHDSPTWFPPGLYRTGWLLLDEPNIHESFRGPHQSHHWNCTVSRTIRRFHGIKTVEDYLERRNKEKITKQQQATSQLQSFLGYMYRKPGSDDIESGMSTWVKNLTEPNKETGVKLEVALLNAFARLGIPTLFGGDIPRVEPKSGESRQSGPATPVFDLAAVRFGGPTLVLVSCKSTENQPKRIDIALLSDEARKVQGLLPDWLVFGVLVNLGEPTADEFTYRQDVRIWKQSDMQALLHAKDYQSIAQFLWTPPWHWNRTIETLWQNTYGTHHL